MTPPPGRPVWFDLGTHDLDGARRFYAELFGWEFVDQGPDFGGYQMIRKGQMFLAGAMSSMVGPDGPTTEPQYPTAWNVYLDVADIDAALARAQQHGGTVLVPAMQVGGAGSMALVQAPDGAVVGMWQADDFTGFETDMSQGTPVWVETLSKDYDRAVDFYTRVFDWQPAPMPSGGGAPRYATNGEGRDAHCGICEADGFLPEQVPSFWRLYLQVDDVDASLERVEHLGGSVVDGPMDSPFGRLATVADPQGATFQVIHSAFQG